MSVLWLIPIFAAISLFVWWLKRHAKKQSAADHPIIYNVDIDTPLKQGLFADGVWSVDANGERIGATVRPLKELGPTPVEALARMDAGIAHQIRNSSRMHPDWTGFRNVTDYQVYLIKPDTHTVENDPGAPAIFVKNLLPGSTTQTYDIEAAGTCIGVPGGILGGYTDNRYPSMVIPYEAGELDSHADWLEESVPQRKRTRSTLWER